MRTRLPTCLSIGFGVFLAIIIMRSSITPVYGVMAVDSNSVTIDSNSYAIHIPMVRHQVMRKCDKLPFLRAVSPWLSRVGCDGDSAHAAHNPYLWGFERSRLSLFRNTGSKAAAHDEKQCDGDHDKGRSIADAGVERRADWSRQRRIDHAFAAERQ